MTTLRLLILFVFLFLSVFAWSNEPTQNPYATQTINASFENAINVNPFAVFHISDKSVLLSDVRDLKTWQSKSEFTNIPKDSVLWVRFNIVNNANTNKMLTLIAGNVFVDQVDVFLLDEQARIIQSARSLDEHSGSANLSRKGFKMDLVSRAESILTVYIRIQDDGKTILPLELWQNDAYYEETGIRLILLGAMSGGLSLLATYFLLTYILRNAPARFWFCLFATGAMTTMLSSQGIFLSIFFIPSLTAELTSLSMVVTLFASIKITRIVFAPIPLWWTRIHYFMLGLPLVGIFLLSDLYQLLALMAFSILFFISMLAATAIYRHGIDLRSAAIYFVGWSCLGMVGALELIGFINNEGYLSYTLVYPFGLTCLGVMLVGVAIISREQSVQARRLFSQREQIQQLQQYNDLFQHAAEGLYTALPNGDLIQVNPAISSLFGYTNSAAFLATNRNIADFLANEKDADLLLGELSIQQTVLGKEIKGKRNDGSEFWFSISCQLKKVNGEKLHFGSLFDITERRLHQINLQYLNTHDQLTGLFNRRHFLHVMNERIGSAQANKKFALIFLDVDQFKVINDTCGHSAGDIFIKELSHELFDVVSDKYPFARLSADQFGLIVDFENSIELRKLANALLEKVRKFEFKWDRHIFNQSVSIGIAPCDDSIPSGEELLSYADTACLIAKEGGRDKIHIYSPEMGMHSNYKRDLFWVNEVNIAIKEENFELYYQHYRPLNQSDTAQYYEILVRLRTKDNDLVTPEFFMPSAEKALISNKIDKQVVETYFKWLQANLNHLDNLGKANINLSGLCLSDDDFQYFLLNAFEKYAIPYHKICFEITETMAIIRMNDAVEFMNKFKRLGCTFALDDFGSGFSSYSYLKDLPVDFVKIDGHFIRDILHDPIDLAMVTSIKDVAEAMNIKTVAEFVETPEIMVQIGKMGVDFAQGYCIAKPEPLSSYADFVSDIK